jgi:hypothetical protein
MRITGIFLLLLSSLSFAGEYPACNIAKSKEVSFQSNNSKDILEVSVIGTPCYEAKFKIRVISSSKETIYEYNSTFKQHNSIHWEDPNLDKDAEKHVNYVLEHAITTSSKLPDVFACEIPDPQCEPYEKNVVPLEEYRSIKESNVPMLNHSTYYEGWASFVFNPKTKKTIKVLEGGV